MTQATLSPPKVEAPTVKAYEYQLGYLLSGDYPNWESRLFLIMHREYLDGVHGEGMGKRVLNDAARSLSTEFRDRLKAIMTAQC